MFTRILRHAICRRAEATNVPCQIYRLVAIEADPFASPCHRFSPKSTTSSIHGDLTSIKGDAMRFRSRDGRAAQTGKETAHPARDPDCAASRAMIT
jgi:hypothetical protein